MLKIKRNQRFESEQLVIKKISIDSKEYEECWINIPHICMIVRKERYDVQMIQIMTAAAVIVITVETKDVQNIDDWIDSYLN